MKKSKIVKDKLCKTFIKDIKASKCGRVELSGKDAVRFVQLLEEDKPNPLALAAPARGREIRVVTWEL